jgi:hypothetical protein
MAVLTAMTSKSTLDVRPTSIAAVVRGPGVNSLLRYRQLSNTWSLFAAQKLLSISLLIFSLALVSTQILAITALRMARFVISSMAKGLVELGRTSSQMWKSKRVQRWRKKLMMEVAFVILGPGNAFILMAFWPGWLFLGLMVWAGRLWLG